MGKRSISPRTHLAMMLLLGGLGGVAVGMIAVDISLPFTDKISPAVVLPIASVLGALAMWLSMRAVLRRFNVENAAGLALITAKQYVDAEAKFAALAVRYRRRPLLCALARHNQAFALQRRGELDEALRLAELAEPQMARFPAYAALSALQLAVDNALLGNVAAAEAWIATSRARPSQKGFLRIFPEALVLARAGHHATVVQLLDREWQLAETRLTAADLRRLRLLRAFALASSSGPRDAGPVEAALRENGAPRPGEFDALAVKWPELRAFLDGHGL